MHTTTQSTLTTTKKALTKTRASLKKNALLIHIQQRHYRNPRTGVDGMAPPKERIRFKASINLKKIVETAPTSASTK
jgi:Bacterial DNA-binding protein